MDVSVDRASALESASASVLAQRLHANAPSFLRSRVACKPPHDTLPTALERAASSGSPFITFHSGPKRLELSFAEALIAARRWSAHFLDQGTKRRDRIAIFLPTSAEFAQSFLGVVLCGAIPVPLPFPISLAGVERFLRNLLPIIADSGARQLVTTAQIRDLMLTDDRLRASFSKVMAEGDIAAEVSRVPKLLHSVSPDDVAFIQYTSGTTGRPKGVLITHRALMANAFAIADGLRLRPEDVGVSWLPMFHDMGLIGALLTPICHPYAVHLMSPAAFIMRPHRWLQLLSEVGGTISTAPNFAYELCVSRPCPGIEKLCLEAWRAALNGSERVGASTISGFTARFAQCGFRAEALTPVYGMAETTLAASFSALDQLPRYSRGLFDQVAAKSCDDQMLTGNIQGAVSVGSPVAGTTICIGDALGNVISQGAVGEVRISSASLMAGYFENADATAAALNEGWLRTGDLGFIQDEQLYIVGRSSDVIIKGGRNIYPTDIERIAIDSLGHSARAVAAFSRPNPVTGTEDLVLAVETPECDLSRRDAMVNSVRVDVLSELGVGVDCVHLCPSGTLPRTTSGKVRRRSCASVLYGSHPPHDCGERNQADDESHVGF